MRKLLLIISLSAVTANIFFLNSHAQAQLTLEPEIEPIFMKGIYYAYRNELDSALTLFDSIEKMTPKSPVGAFCKAFTYDLFMDEYRSLVFMDEFNDAVERSIVLAEKQEASGSETAETYLFLGGVYGIRGVRKSHDRRLVGSVQGRAAGYQGR